MIKEIGKLSAQPSSTIHCGNQGPKLALAHIEKANQQKGPHFIPMRSTHNDTKVEGKDATCPNLISSLGIVESNRHIGESQR